jgi:hypothetical protein
MLLLNKIKTDLNLTRNEFIYGLVTTTRRLERLAAQVEVTCKFCAAPKEAARVAVINPPSVRNMKKMWVVKDTADAHYRSGIASKAKVEVRRRVNIPL